MAEKHDDLVLEVIRESGKENWLNRFCQNADTHEIVYYCETDSDHSISIHKGDKNGPIIATGNSCLMKDGVTDINFRDPAFSIQLEHIHHKLPSLHGKTFFTLDSKKYHWKGHSALIEDDTGILLAAFNSRLFEFTSHKIGSLIITEEGKKFADLVVVTALVVQERSDEARQARELAQKRAMEAGIRVP